MTLRTRPQLVVKTNKAASPHLLHPKLKVKPAELPSAQLAQQPVQKAEKLDIADRNEEGSTC